MDDDKFKLNLLFFYKIKTINRSQDNEDRAQPATLFYRLVTLF
ncbi:hypothetical protein GRPL_00350 [Raoultella planticola ATCC 33531]|nr:hypothetical protein GRPL_00350 [Raoultella planticola ATCC 33531]